MEISNLLDHQITTEHGYGEIKSKSTQYILKQMGQVSCQSKLGHSVNKK